MKFDPPKSTAAAANPLAAAPPSSSGAPGMPQDDADLEALLGNDDFAKELAKNMASFLGDGVRCVISLRSLAMPTSHTMLTSSQ